MAGDTSKPDPAARKSSVAPASALAAAPLSGIAKLISAEAAVALAGQSWEAASALHALDQRLQEVLVALPSARDAVDDASDVGAALKALSTLLT